MEMNQICVVSVQTMRDSDAWTIEHKTPSKELMYRAGKGLFNQVRWDAPVGIICGKGNNAGDGYVVALLLQEAHVPVTLILLEERFSEDGAYYFKKCMNAGIPYELYSEKTNFSAFGYLVDCLLGTGFSGDVREPMASLIRKINASGAYVVSADINSGLNGDTGEGRLFVYSDLTVSIGTYKYGHFKGQASKAMKRKVNVDIGIEIRGSCEVISTDTQLTDE